jgi:hypothetical protein
MQRASKPHKQKRHRSSERCRQLMNRAKGGGGIPAQFVTGLLAATWALVDFASQQCTTGCADDCASRTVTASVNGTPCQCANRATYDQASCAVFPLAIHAPVLAAPFAILAITVLVRHIFLVTSCCGRDRKLVGGNHGGGWQKQSRCGQGHQCLLHEFSPCLNLLPDETRRMNVGCMNVKQRAQPRLSGDRMMVSSCLHLLPVRRYKAIWPTSLHSSSDSSLLSLQFRRSFRCSAGSTGSSL